jgi:hypothetical protein
MCELLEKILKNPEFKGTKLFSELEKSSMVSQIIFSKR